MTKEIGVELILGTAQFGMAYGVVGRGCVVPMKEIKSILNLAWEGGIRIIDTAPVYGNIESQLNTLLKKRTFEVISKIPAIPASLSINEKVNYVCQEVNKIRKHLGDNTLKTLLFHHASDLTQDDSEYIWQAAYKATENTSCQLGISCYSLSELTDILKHYPIHVAQVPGNAFDQRIKLWPENRVEIHLRSVFFQGILLAEINKIPKKLGKILPYQKVWRKWCAERGLKPLEAALGIVKGFPSVKYCLVGVDYVQHLAAILDAWFAVKPICAPELCVQDVNIIDPRYWS